ncbi:MAG: tetratricopeptide repeat protein [Elusimicrobia bacterium]|nr:tetratricopeptide repeat protein [Elusimicrobiota bacterium]
MAKDASGVRIEPERALGALWMLGAAVFWLVPDQKLIRAKLLAVQAVVLLAGGRLAWRAAARRDPGRRSALDGPAAALSAAGLVFWALSPDLAVSQSEAARLLFCGLAFWTASRSFALTSPEPFLASWSAAAAAAASWALLEAAQGRSRPFASFGNPIFLGTALASALPLTLARALKSAGANRALWTAAAALQGAGLLLARSRAAAFGLLAGLSLWALASLEGRRRLGALGGAAALAAAAAWAFLGREWTHVLIWRDTLALWRSHPLIGCGLGRFHLEFPAFASAELKARWPEGRMIVNFAHNEYLQTLAETGPLGLAALLAVPAAAWLMLKRGGAGEGRLERGAATAGALALFSAALVSPDMRLGASSFAAFALLGAASRAEASGAAPRAIFPLGALLVFLGLAAQSPLAVRRNAAEAPFHAGADAIRLRELEERLARSPRDADAAEELGFLKAKASDFDGARAAFRRASRLAPSRPGPLNNLGNLAYLAGDFDEAIGWWEKSLAAAPAQIDARINLAKLLCERGRLKACSGHLDEVLRREPSNAKARVLYKKMLE